MSGVLCDQCNRRRVVAHLAVTGFRRMLSVCVCAECSRKLDTALRRVLGDATVDEHTRELASEVSDG